MYTGTLIEDLIATVERTEHCAAEPAEMLPPDDLNGLPLAFLLEQSYGEQLVEVA